MHYVDVRLTALTAVKDGVGVPYRRRSAHQGCCGPGAGRGGHLERNYKVSL